MLLRHTHDRERKFNKLSIHILSSIISPHPSASPHTIHMLLLLHAVTVWWSTYRGLGYSTHSKKQRSGCVHVLTILVQVHNSKRMWGTTAAQAKRPHTCLLAKEANSYLSVLNNIHNVRITYTLLTLRVTYLTPPIAPLFKPLPCCLSSATLRQRHRQQRVWLSC